MFRIIKLLVVICVVCSSCDFVEDKNENKPVVLTHDSLMKLKHYVHDTIFVNAQDKYKTGEIVDIKKTYIRMYETDTNNVDYTIDLAKILIASHDTKEALHFLDVALAKDKNYAALVYFEKSIAWSWLLNRDSSYYYLGKAIEHDDSLRVRYLIHRSQKYEEDSLFDKAIEDMNVAIKKQPANKGLFVFRGIYKKRLAKYKEALIDMKEIPTYLQKDANVYGNRAFVYMKLGKFKECIEDCDKSISINPNVGGIYGVRANAKSNLQDFEGAYEDLKRAVKLGNQEAIPMYEEYKKYFDTHKKV